MRYERKTIYICIQLGSPGDRDVASVISGNSLVGKKENARAGDTEDTESKLILFNGLYYRGNWAIPFQVNIIEKFLPCNYFTVALSNCI